MMLKLKHVPEGIGNTRTVECLFRNTVDVEGERLCVLQAAELEECNDSRSLEPK